MKITECGEETSGWLEKELLISFGKTNAQAENSNILLAAKDDDGQITGGLVASTSYGWLLVKILWVEKSHRSSGIGRSLMEHAELSAQTRGCHGAWLDTSSADAHKFYVSLGYEIFGELQNHGAQIPSGHQRWFMKKQLHL